MTMGAPLGGLLVPTGMIPSSDALGGMPMAQLAHLGLPLVQGPMPGTLQAGSTGVANSNAAFMPAWQQHSAGSTGILDTHDRLNDGSNAAQQAAVTHRRSQSSSSSVGVPGRQLPSVQTIAPVPPPSGDFVPPLHQQQAARHPSGRVGHPHPHQQPQGRHSGDQYPSARQQSIDDRDPDQRSSAPTLDTGGAVAAGGVLQGSRRLPPPTAVAVVLDERGNAIVSPPSPQSAAAATIEALNSANGETGRVSFTQPPPISGSNSRGAPAPASAPATSDQHRQWPVRQNQSAVPAPNSKSLPLVITPALPRQERDSPPEGPSILNVSAFPPLVSTSPGPSAPPPIATSVMTTAIPDPRPDVDPAGIPVSLGVARGSSSSDSGVMPGPSSFQGYAAAAAMAPTPTLGVRVARHSGDGGVGGRRSGDGSGRRLPPGLPSHQLHAQSHGSGWPRGSSMDGPFDDASSWQAGSGGQPSGRSLPGSAGGSPRATLNGSVAYGPPLSQGPTGVRQGQQKRPGVDGGGDGKQRRSGASDGSRR